MKCAFLGLLGFLFLCHAAPCAEEPLRIEELSYDALKNLPGWEKSAEIRWQAENSEVFWERIDFRQAEPNKTKIASATTVFSPTNVSIYQIVNDTSRGPLMRALTPSAITAVAANGRTYIAIRNRSGLQITSISSMKPLEEVKWRLVFGEDERDVELKFGEGR